MAIKAIPGESRGVVLGTLALVGLTVSWLIGAGVTPLSSGLVTRTRLARAQSVVVAQLKRFTDSEHKHWADAAAASLLQMDQNRCSLPGGVARQLYDNEIESRMQEYLRLTGQQYPLPKCSDL